MPTRAQSSTQGDTPSPSPSPAQSPAVPPSGQRNLSVRPRSEVRSVSGSKRKRAGTSPRAGTSSRRRTVDPDANETADEDDEEGRITGREATIDVDDDDLYDPDQSLEERRKIQRGLRDLLKGITENREDVLTGDFKSLHNTIKQANKLSKHVRQTNEATKDSRLLVTTTDLSYRKVALLTQGNLTHGVDVDEFVSKCITYMREGSGISNDDALELSSTQRHRRRSIRDAREDDDDGDMMNWQHLGRYAALPYIRRPALPGFLLGPLSVEKKVRKMTKRSAPFRPNDLTETRPEVLRTEDFARKENDLTVTCSRILQRLIQVQADVQERVADLIDDDMDDKEKIQLMHEHGLRDTGGIDLMRFVVNPKSFGQTIENIFYVSFLIRDGRVEIEYDEHDLPALAPVEREAEDDGRIRHGAAKHQAILSMDMATWQDIIDTLGLTEPIIEHRQEATNNGPGARGWYS